MNKSGFVKIAYLIAIFVTVVMAAQAQTLNNVVYFDLTDGAYPFGALIQGTDGNYYGTTNFGAGNGEGNVYKLTPEGEISTVYSFCAKASCSDGEHSYATLVQYGNGNFYGTTNEGGLGAAAGTVFEVTPNGKLTTLYNFCPAAPCGTVGSQPASGVTEGFNGNLYGVTIGGGTNLAGTVYEITSTGTSNTLYSFCSLANCADGSEPFSALLQATNGNLFGSTYYGGVSSNCPYSGGCGTIFQITPSGKLNTVRSFCQAKDCFDGYQPEGALIQGANGNLYGTTINGGGPSDAGTIFQIGPQGKFSKLYSFCSLANCADGSQPSSGLVLGSDGNFYGVTTGGGAYKQGTVFQFTPEGALTTLYSFCAQSFCPDGANPWGGLMQTTDGTFYGTANDGGGTDHICTDGCGTIFQLTMGLAPFVEAQPNFAKAGHSVAILGNDLTGTTSVTFNGIPATFTVASNTLLKVTVPSGASTGTIAVTTPNGTLNSNTAFQLVP